MAKTDASIITLSITIKGEEHVIRFIPSLQDYNKYINDISMSDKVVPATNYLKRVVHSEDKELLDALIKHPSVGITLAAELNEEYVGDIQVEIKK